MSTILITGATGNIGREVINALTGVNFAGQIIAGIRNVGDAKKFEANAAVKTEVINFEKPATFKPALQKCDTLFLLRPPQLADVKKYFVPLIDAVQKSPVSHIVFLSVQGVEDNPFIPHYKIEQLIKGSGINYTFLRPAYFYQNFTTTLNKDILVNKRIYLPAGGAKFTLIDVEDIGKVAAKILTSPEKYVNKSYDLTSRQALTFGEMAAMISRVIGEQVSYISPNLLQFVRQKRKEDVSFGFIAVMIMLHYLPRFKSTPPISDSFTEITGEEPTSFEIFARKNADKLH